MVRGEVLLALFLLSPEVLNSMAFGPRQPQISTLLMAIRLFLTQTNFTNQWCLVFNPGLKSLLFREILQQLHLTGKPPLALNSMRLLSLIPIYTEIRYKNSAHLKLQRYPKPLGTKFPALIFIPTFSSVPGVIQKRGEGLGRGFCQLMEFPVSSRNPDFFQVMGGNNPKNWGGGV